MSGSTTILDQISLSAAQQDKLINALFGAGSPSITFGRHDSACSGLTWGYYGGCMPVAGVPTQIPNDTILLTNNATNYVEATTAGVVSSNTSGFTGGRIALFIVVASAGLTTWTDVRFAQAVAPTSFTGGTLSGALNESGAVTLASAATVNIGAAAANTINVSGTTTITAFDTIAASALRRVVFAGVLTLTHNATSLILPTAASITTAAGDVAEFISLGAGNWKCTYYTRANGTSLAGSAFTGGTLTSALNGAPPATLASAGTVNIGAASTNDITVSGTTAITAFDTIAAGAMRTLTFSGSLVLTHNATSLILPGAANITTAAGDVAEFESLGSGNWRCYFYQKANGQAVVGSSFTGGTLSSALNEAPAVTIASASTVNIGAAAANTILVTGTVTITAFDTIAASAIRRTVFSGILTLTHSGTALILPTGASITTAAGDVAEFVSLGSGNWRCFNYMRASGAALAGGPPSGSAGGDLAGTYPNPTVKASVSLTTPTIGVATATSVNKMAITAPATSSTLAVADGKTLTASNTLTLAGTDSTTMTFPEITAEIGFRNIPQNSQSTAYTTVMADKGKGILHPAADTTARTFTIDSNANVAYPIGTAITFINQNAAGVLTIAITSDTMRLAGAGTTGSRTLAANGVATAIKIATTEWIISGGTSLT